jgi:hypothetical protein
MRILLPLAAACALCAAAWGADLVVERAPATEPEVSSPTYDGTLELKWDSGSSAWLIAFYTGAGTWFGNDFDISTVSSYRTVDSMRIYAGPAWPNGRWDGWRLGIYSFTSVPGSLLWGPKFVVGTSSSYGWNNFAVTWTLPASNNAFVAALEQFYNYPNMDPHVVDNNPTFLRHSWLYYGGSWRSYYNATGYYNLMVRVIVNDSGSGVKASSIGRVKSLYY